MPPKRQQTQNQDSDDEIGAKREEELIDDDDGAPFVDDEDEGEDLEENQSRDYQTIRELDNYEADGIDDEAVQGEDHAAIRAAAERDIVNRQKADRGEDIDEYMDDNPEATQRQRILKERRRLYYEEDQIQPVDERRYLDAEEVRGKLAEWINEDDTIRYIKSKFSRFLCNFKGENSTDPIYERKLRLMCINNSQNIQVSYLHLKEAAPTLAIWVALEPALILPELNNITYGIACRNFSTFKSVFAECFVKIYDLPVKDQIRDLRHFHVGKLIKVVGVVTVRSEVYNQLKMVVYKCGKCGYPKGPFYINNVNPNKLGQCASCQGSGPFLLDRLKTIYRNHQTITLQESPSSVEPGRIPRSKQVILVGDCIDSARPGEEIIVTGVYLNRYECQLNIRHGFPLFSTYIEANHVRKTMETSASDDDAFREQDFFKFSKDKDLAEKIFASIAPSIYGHHFIKKALTLALFGGVEKLVENTHRIRGDINVLLLGDPGIAKSQFLKSIQRIFDRSIYTTGKGASAVGLTACVRKDHATGDWKLEAGALVMADKGICLIDEFDKMSEQDRTSIHEAMEQQSISISKAGIVTTLRARCSVIAAANPIQGRYNPQLSFKDNVDLSDPILSRFDVLAVVRDEVNLDIDSELAAFVINSHIINHPHSAMNSGSQLLQLQPQGQVINFQFLRNYIIYARKKCQPVFNDKHKDLVVEFYKKLRSESDKTGGISISVRHIESLIRMATAHAKMHLRNEVSRQDVNMAIRMMLDSFIQTQKYANAKRLQRAFAMYFE